MKAAGIVFMIISVLLMGSTLLCGFWIRSHTAAGAPADASSVNFHIQIAVATILSVLITFGIQIFSK